MKRAAQIIAHLERDLRNLRFELDLADLSDDERLERRAARGYVTEGHRWPRRELERHIAGIEATLEEVRRRSQAGDAPMIDAMYWYGTARWFEAFERLEKYAERWQPAIRARQTSAAALAEARHRTERKIDDATYERLAPTARSAKELAAMLGVHPSTLSRYRRRRGIS